MAEKYRPANGTEFTDFYAAWCDRCKRDAAFRTDPDAGAGCDIIADTMTLAIDDPDYPPEWISGPGGRPMCAAFDATGEDGDDD